jgi:hypothetical protein
METISSFPSRPAPAAREREVAETAGLIEEIWHTAPLLAYVEHEEAQESEERDWPLDPTILHGLVHP